MFFICGEYAMFSVEQIWVLNVKPEHRLYKNIIDSASPGHYTQHPGHFEAGCVG